MDQNSHFEDETTNPISSGSDAESNRKPAEPERLVDKYRRRYEESLKKEATDPAIPEPEDIEKTAPEHHLFFEKHSTDETIRSSTALESEYDEALSSELSDESELDKTPVNPPAGEPGYFRLQQVEKTDVEATRVTSAAYRGAVNGIPSGRGVPPSSTDRIEPAQSLPQEKVPVQTVKRQQPASMAQQPANGWGVNGQPATPASDRPGGGMGRSARPPASGGRLPANGGRPPGNGKAKPPKKRAGCFVQGLIITFFVLTLVLLLSASYGMYRYYQIASILPDVSTLRDRAAKFETTRILDRNGNVLYEINDPNAGRRTYVTLDQISANLIAATLATEDKDFYNNPGFDIFGIARALYQNYTAKEVVSGASTITQQLARMLLLSDAERYEVSADRKAREIILAAEITRRFSKNEILELYLNEVNYGNLAYGVQAASETYFNTSAANLTIAQAAFLAGLPQSPSIYDVYNNREVTLNRTRQVLVLMYTLSGERNCIDVDTPRSRICLDAADAAIAVEEINKYPFTQQAISFRYPHWVFYVRSVLENMYDPQTIYRSGFTVYTTIDPELQDFAQQIVTNQVARLADHNASGGALVAIKPSTGEILAMVGSPDFNNEAASGQVNMAVSPRQPGSSIKPLTFVAAFEKGWTPATLIWDVPTDFSPSGRPNDPMPPYQPKNYDGTFHGPVTVRTALGNSYNIPAVKALEFVGVYDDPNTPNPDGLVNFAKRLGIDSLTREDYGLSLTLGGGDVSLLQMTGAFGVFANNGIKQTPVSITKILDSRGNEVYSYNPGQGEQVIRTEHAYLISDILADNEARSAAFGPNSVLNLPFRVAAKTGTTNDFRDNWTIGYTPDLVTGVWVGNPDYTSMSENTTGLTGAAPIWGEFMQYAITKLTGGNPTPFYKPNTITERIICAVSGTEPSEWCSSQRAEAFAIDQLPLPKEEDLWQKVQLNTWTNLAVSPYCSDFTEEKMGMNVNDPWAIKWLRETETGKNWATSNGFEEPLFIKPDRQCTEHDLQPTIEFAGLNSGQIIEETPLDIYAIVHAPTNFSRFRLEWGKGDDPEDWQELMSSGNQYIQPEKIHSWDLSEIKDQTVTLRIYVESTIGTYAERKIIIHPHIPEPTATPSPTPTATPIFTPTLTPTEVKILLPSQTPVPPPPTAIPPPPVEPTAPLEPTP